MENLVGSNPHYENHFRSIAKAITFRSVILLCHSAIVSLIVQKGSEAMTIVVSVNVMSTIWYYLHERLWNFLPWFKETIDENGLHKDHYHRSFIKAVTYRLVILTSDFVIVSLITKNSSQTLDVVLLINGVSTLLYFIHERIWNNVHLGKSSKNLQADIKE